MATKTKLGVNLLFGGWLGLLILCLLGIPVADLLTESYDDLSNSLPHLAGAPDLLKIRPWMVHYNTAVSICHAAVLAVMFVGAFRYLRRSERSLFGSIATVGFGGALLGTVCMLLFPVLIGSGPWPMESAEVSGFVVLVFLPLVLRSGAFTSLALSFAVGANNKKGLVFLGYWLVFGLSAVDFALSIWKWVATDVTVYSLFHPFLKKPIALIPWTAASVVFLVLMWLKRERGPSS